MSVGIRCNRTRLRRAIGCGAALSGCLWSLAAGAQIAFTEVAAEVGLDYLHNPQFGAGVQLMIAGGAVADFNRDGWQDIFIPSDGSQPDKLFVNLKNGTFREVGARIGLTDLYLGAGVAVGDYNDDGWPDIFVTSFGVPGSPLAPGAHRLYRNRKGLGVIEVAAAAGVTTTSPVIADGFGAAFGDYDLDGDLDLFVAGWFEGSEGNRLFRNNGDATFSDVTEAAGVLDLTMHGFTPCFVDMNGDRYPELLIAGDFGTSRYFVNMGDGSFEDHTADSGTGLDANGMGSATGDLDNDGDFDWYVSSVWSENANPEVPEVPGTGNMLYLNEGGDSFIESAMPSHTYDGGWGWGTTIADVDNDGLLDIIETNGWPTWPDEYGFVGEGAKLFHNLGDNQFEEIAAQAGFTHSGQGRGLVQLDYDNDGDQDLMVFSYGGALELYRNDTQTTNNWFRVKSIDTTADPSLPALGFGTVIRATAGGVTHSRYVGAACSYLSQSETALHFGLGQATTVDFEIELVDGTVRVVEGVPVNLTPSLVAPAP